MTSELSNLAARLRKSIASGSFEAEVFNRHALELFRLQFAHNHPYRRICEARGIAQDSVNYWPQIPVAPTVAFKEFELTCLPPAMRSHVFHSSGTTSHQMSRHFHSTESLALYDASLWAWFRANVLPDFQSVISDLGVAILTPPPREAPQSSLIHMLEVVRRELSAGNGAFVGRVEPDAAWTLDFAKALEMVGGACQTGKPLMLLGTAFSFVHLLDYLTEHELRFHLPPGSRVMETGGYKNRSRSLPKAQLHALLTQQLGVPPSRIVCEYGMCELSSQAYDGVSAIKSEVSGAAARNMQYAGRVFHFPPWARVQIVSPETGLEVGEGETGLIRVFDLANVYSVLAIQTEDLGIRRGDGFELVGRAANVEPRGCSLMAVNS